MKRKLKIFTNISIILASVALAFSLIFGAVYLAIMLVLTFYNAFPEYPEFSAHGEAETKSYDISGVSGLSLFPDNSHEHYTFTDFKSAKPNLKIINDTEYKMEITANAELMDVLDVIIEDGFATLQCDKSIYKLEKDNFDGGYCYSSRIDCSQMDIVVHAPISHLSSDTSITFDFDVAKADLIKIYLWDSVGSAYNIDANLLNVSCYGSTRLSLSGDVSGTAYIYAMHDSHIKARELDVERYDRIRVDRAPFSFSYVTVNKWYRVKFEIIGIATVLDAIAFLPIIFWLDLDVALILIRKLFLSESTTKKKKEKAL